MVNKRLINCDFIKDMEVSNKALLLYLMFFLHADDMGFVGKGNKIIKLLNDKEKEETNNALIPFTYDEALVELINKGLLLEFTNNHNDKIYLVRQWFYHNKFLDRMETNYESLLSLVDLIDNEYNQGEGKILKERGNKKGIEKKRKEGNRKKEDKKDNNNSLILNNSFNCFSSSNENDSDETILSREELLSQLNEDNEE